MFTKTLLNFYNLSARAKLPYCFLEIEPYPTSIYNCYDDGLDFSKNFFSDQGSCDLDEKSGTPSYSLAALFLGMFLYVMSSFMPQDFPLKNEFRDLSVFSIFVYFLIQTAESRDTYNYFPTINLLALIYVGTSLYNRPPARTFIFELCSYLEGILSRLSGTRAHAGSGLVLFSSSVLNELSNNMKLYLKTVEKNPLELDSLDPDTVAKISEAHANYLCTISHNLMTVPVRCNGFLYDYENIKAWIDLNKDEATCPKTNDKIYLRDIQADWGLFNEIREALNSEKTCSETVSLK